ncbi:LexA family transcriptional regulator [Chryseobacterium herbae]|uniref:Helix-turn-helix domain-containing protein n=1 Tax=Chryseobacterium herbae TaxID=2976476 RepID=A0ABT2IYQ3_9FLAO|nr:helix-turn-helix domain-containing protein [Chryseobacterium sp. pc1-10]MCT2563978.1 helix-turn-helix domain-containing protein [Chryseobacterium sp. pc1-10]
MGIEVDNSLIIDKIKTRLGFEKDKELADFLDIKPNTLANWRKRNMLDYQLIFTKCEWIDGNFLFTGSGSIERQTKINNYKDIDITTSFEHKVPQVVTIDSNQKDNVVLVPVKARAGYLTGYHKPEFIQNLPTYRLPNLNNGIFRMFEVKGESMNQTLPNKSIAVGEWVENWVENIKDGRIYIIVYDDGDKFEDGLIIKRCLNRIKKYNNLICKSDTLDRADYPNISIDPRYIKEVWELKGAFKFEFPDPSNLFKRIDDLEANFQQLFNLMPKNKLEK